MPLQSNVSASSSGSIEAESTQSDGKTFQQLRNECLQKGVLFEDPDFPAKGSSLFFSESVPVNIEWKRPKELCSDPKFIVGGADRTDICQGQLGDCWLLAAIASLTLRPELMARVIPRDQEFDSRYAGIFHFQFWQHNKWLDVVVDDRLPSVRNKLIMLHSVSNNEFWSALMEKAYAKLNGSYEALKGGSTMEAMEDFTGGVGETYETKSASENLFTIMKKALDRGSLMGCSIDVKTCRNTDSLLFLLLQLSSSVLNLCWFFMYQITSSAESEAKTTTGLVKGHAYSITGLDMLIRIRNPWGEVEWNGPWSDNSREWNYIDKADKARLQQNSLDDGEFWMEFGDFRKNYDKVEICNLTPDALTDDTKHQWEVNAFEGNWIRGSTAGGCRNFIDTFWTNPQFKLELQHTDDNHDLCSVVIAVMQKNRRKLRKEGLDLETIGFAVYEVRSKHVGKDFFRYHPSKARSRTYINMREVSERFTLPPGKYLLVPTTFQPHQEADFLVRLLGKNEEVDCTCWFKKWKCWTKRWKSGSWFVVQVVKDELVLLQMLFLAFDTDRSGKMSSYELRSALNAAGMRLNNQLLQLIGLRFADEDYEIDFDDYLTCIVRLENMFRAFQALDKFKRGRVKMNIMQVKSHSHHCFTVSE
uniref:Calpain 9 n=1 Tax=Anabas testudineus TaxID=64144 RepID=A0A7N6FIG7_ANATE